MDVNMEVDNSVSQELYGKIQKVINMLDDTFFSGKGKTVMFLLKKRRQKKKMKTEIVYKNGSYRFRKRFEIWDIATVAIIVAVCILILIQGAIK